uniref:Integrase catalytic domain-containing protein n=1 Tax=Nicotiana tabacum TaxID=4097 RepID=A0A1S4AVT4_TOBAC|nr:PREDICTED: uncharacterized protein LOC107801933 [Nicotiana tabacum]
MAGGKVDVTHTGSACLLDKETDLCNCRVKGIGRNRGGLYFLRNGRLTNKLKIICAMSRLCGGTSSLGYMRLGHPSLSTMKNIKELHSYVSIIAENNCFVCPLAKQTRLKFSLNDSRADGLFHRVHMDLWGPYKVPTFNNMYYLLTIVDDHSRYTWSSCPYTPQQNGIVERKHRHILDTTRALKFQGSIPMKCWGICVNVAVYLINRFPSKTLGGKVPFELLHCRKASLLHLRVIGCLCYATNLPKEEKFTERAKTSVLMGYSATQKGYILLDLQTRQLFTSRDVVFREYEFPFAKGSTNMSKESELPMSYPLPIKVSISSPLPMKVSDHSSTPYGSNLPETTVSIDHTKIEDDAQYEAEGASYDGSDAAIFQDVEVQSPNVQDAEAQMSYTIKCSNHLKKKMKMYHQT